MRADIQYFKNRAVTDNCQSLDFKAKKQMDKDQKEEDGAETQERGMPLSFLGRRACQG